MGSARVLFDEAHSEAWTVRAEVAAQMQPAHPGDACYGMAAQALAKHGFIVTPNVSGPLTGDALASCDVLVIAHPSEPAWERTTGSGSPRLSIEELDAIESFVASGGGLIVLGETEQEKYGNNLNELLGRFGIHLENETVQDYEHHAGAPSWIMAELGTGARGREADVLARVRAACLYRATTISVQNEGSAPANPASVQVRAPSVLARAQATASSPGAPLIVAGEHGAGRVVALADSDLFGDDCLHELDHRELWLNLVYWAGAHHRLRQASNGRGDAAITTDPAWIELRDSTDQLARLQEADGSVPADDRPSARPLVDTIEATIERLAPRFEHQRAYLDAVRADLRTWVDCGFAKPDFTVSLDAFRPERDRVDGIQNLVFFPMYKQNASRDVCCEALLIRVPWPEWIGELERTRYDNPKYVPVELLDSTRGYRSECAVLFPETVSVAGRPVNNFGAIFCDREAERLARVAGAAADLLALNLPPDAAWLLDDPERLEQTYIVWDLIHDRTHSHGELPFDPFMIRQRSPYWMYSLEELRCDLTTFAEAATLGEVVGRQVQYAILLDRLLRFPITGSRVRNYDGLGGQLLFAYLHRHGYLHWADNQLTIEWDRVADGVFELRADVEELYRAGIDRSKLQHWSAAHDLISASVPPAAGSKWVAGVRDLREVPDPRPYVDLVMDDEFPLSIFYQTLQAKLAA